MVRLVTMMKAFFKTFLGNGQWFLLLGMLFGSAALAADKIPVRADIEVFAREGCPHCAQAEEFLHRLQQEKHDLRIVIRDVSSEHAALERLQQIATQYDVQPRVPAFLIGGQFIVGYSEKLLQTNSSAMHSCAKASRTGKQHPAQQVAQLKRN